MTIATTAGALTLTIGLAVAGWVVVVRQMPAMDMGVATPLGSFVVFMGWWSAMMAAMMLPGAVPAVLRSGRLADPLRAALLFVGSYLAVWTLVGTVVYAVYRPHGTLIAGAIVIAAGSYEFTSLKGHFRRRCRESIGSGLEFGLCCVGSCIGLMLIQIALSLMSVGWMAALATIVLAQKLLPASAALDVPVAFAIVGLGIAILAAPSSVPGLLPAM